jgi:hypothetical protein
MAPADLDVGGRFQFVAYRETIRKRLVLTELTAQVGKAERLGANAIVDTQPRGFR